MMSAKELGALLDEIDASVRELDRRGQRVRELCREPDADRMVKRELERLLNETEVDHGAGSQDARTR